MATSYNYLYGSKEDVGWKRKGIIYSEAKNRQGKGIIYGHILFLSLSNPYPPPCYHIRDTCILSEVFWNCLYMCTKVVQFTPLTGEVREGKSPTTEARAWDLCSMRVNSQKF